MQPAIGRQFAHSRLLGENAGDIRPGRLNKHAQSQWLVHQAGAVVERELRSREIMFMQRVPGMAEKFYALTMRKRFDKVWLAQIVETFRKTAQETGFGPGG